MHITVSNICNQYLILCYVSLDFISHKIVNKGVSLGKKFLKQKLKFQEQITHQNINVLLPLQILFFFSYVNIHTCCFKLFVKRKTYCS